MNYSFIMTRIRNPDRVLDITDAAIRLFMARGYAATRMEMIAEEAGVAPGTLYLYAAGKEALFDLAIRAAFGERTEGEPGEPPRPEDRSSVIEATWRLVRERARFPSLEQAAALPPVGDAAAEFEEIVREFYDWLSRYWRGIRIVEKCALEWPELSTFFYRELRRSGLGLLERYVAGRADQGHLRAMPDPGVAARLILETVSFFAMHRHTAPDSAGMDDAATRATVLAVLRAAFVP
jgi:AcrR family transcriptional regulator